MILANPPGRGKTEYLGWPRGLNGCRVWCVWRTGSGRLGDSVAAGGPLHLGYDTRFFALVRVVAPKGARWCVTGLQCCGRCVGWCAGR